MNKPVISMINLWNKYKHLSSLESEGLKCLINFIIQVAGMELNTPEVKGHMTYWVKVF